MVVMFVMVKVLVDLLQVKNVLKTILHSFQIWGSKPPNKSNEYEHERDSSSNVTTVLVCRTETDSKCQDIQNLSHKQNAAPKTEIFSYVMQCQLEKSYQCFKWLQCIHVQGQSPELLDPEDEGTIVLQKVGNLTLNLHQNCCKNIKSRNIGHTNIKKLGLCMEALWNGPRNIQISYPMTFSSGVC
jgi:hypothetical protein